MEISYNKMYQINRFEARKILIETYQETGSIKATAKQWNTSRNVVRKWVNRYKEKGEKGLYDLSRRPIHSPKRVSEKIEDEVIKRRKETRHGKVRISNFLWQKYKLKIPESTIGKILKRNGLSKENKKRKVFYPAIWAYDQKLAFQLAQVDTKDIYDKGTLGSKICNHLVKNHLPRYQWTFLEGKSRLRFLAFSNNLYQTTGLAFLILVMKWIRSFGIREEIYWQEDWGQEFGGDNPEKLRQIDEKYYKPFGAKLARAPKGRKTYQGRVERSHRTDDEEFYLPFLLHINTQEEFIRMASKWIFWYNTKRPHFGDKMNGKTPYQKLKEDYYRLPLNFCAFPPVILDKIATNLVFDFSCRGGNDLYNYYILVK